MIYRLAPGRGAEILHRFDEVPVGFAPNVGGCNPCCELVPGPDGAMYGATESGGDGYGVIFRITPDGMHDLPGTVGIACNSLLPMSDGSVFGTTTWAERLAKDGA